MTDKEKILHILENYQPETFTQFLDCYMNAFYRELSARTLHNMSIIINRNLKYKIDNLEELRFVARERATYLKSYLNGDLWLTEEAARNNLQPQIDNAQTIIDMCDGK